MALPIAEYPELNFDPAMSNSLELGADQSLLSECDAETFGTVKA
jgi:hypothetical protein